MTIYQVLPRLWGKGKFSDWDSSSFDYLKTLGVTHIWFTGVPRHASDQAFVKGNPGCPYSICDWFDVNPYLADKSSSRLKEFADLVKRTHNNGLNLLIDFIPNHVARNYKGDIPVFDWYDYDWSDTKKINYSAPGCWDKMLEVLRFWASKGVDGFRCDMVELVPKDFLKWAIEKIKEEFPGTVFIAEVYNKDNYREYATQIGFDFLYDKSGFYDSIMRIKSGSEVNLLSWNWQSLQDLQPKMLNFLENHDEERLREPDYAALCAACAFNSASMMIYFGEEIGENAAGSANHRISIFDWEQIPSIKRLTEYIGSMSGLEKREEKVLEKHRKLLTLGEKIRDWNNYDLCYCNPCGMFCFLRYNTEECLLFACNFSSWEICTTINIPDDAKWLSGVNVSQQQMCVDAHGYSMVSLPIEKA